MKIKLKKPSVHFKNDKIFSRNNKEEESEIDENMDEYSCLIKTLKKYKRSRTNKDQARINSYLCNNIEYIRNYTKYIDEESLQKITGLVSYKHYPEDYKIYSFGDEIDKLYIILKGSISILKPVTSSKLMTLRDYVEYLVGIRELEKDEFKFSRIQDYNKKVNRFKLIALDYDYTQIPESKEDTFIIEEEKEINILKEGNIFGEIDFIKEKTREETVITKEECDIASLDRNEFFRLKVLEEQKINNKVSNFRIDYPLLNQWNNLKLSSLIRRLSDETFQKGDLIYKQNDIPEYVYFLKEGELEVYTNTKFHIYEDFIDYIHNGTNSLCNFMDNPFLWQEEKISKKIKKAYEELNYLKFIIKKEKYDEDEELKKISKKQEINENKKNLVDQMEYINNNMKNYSYKANIQKYIAPQMFGYLEALELKRRFCTIKCISNSAIISKIPVMNFLLLIPTDRKNIIYLQSLLFEEKKYLIDQVKNNALAKLTFINSNNLKKKIINIYNSSKSMKGRNNKFIFTKSIKFRNEPNFPFSTKNSFSKSSLIRSENNSLNNLTEKPLIKQSKIINLSKNLKFEKFNDKMVNKFKNTMINLDRKEFNDIKRLYPKSVKHSFSNSNFTFIKKNSYYNDYIKFLEKNDNRMNKSNKNFYGIMTNLRIKNYNIDTNFNFFNKINPRKKRNISLNSKFLLPGINKSKI